MKKKISKKQLTANQQNAKSGGVKTDTGKNISKFNARKHGILSEITTDYERNFLNYFINQVYSEFQPEGFIEEILTEKIALCYFKLFRLNKVEKEFMQSVLIPTITEDGLDWSIGPEPKIIQKGYKQIIETENIEVLHDKYHRYEKSLENRLYKAIHELERIQFNRKNNQNNLPVDIDINLNKNE